MFDRTPLLRALSEIKDPEVGLDIVTMGLIYGIARSEQRLIIAMTMTTPFCPLGPYFTQAVTQAATAAVPDVIEVRVDFVFQPLWQPGMVNREG